LKVSGAAISSGFSTKGAVNVATGSSVPGWVSPPNASAPGTASVRRRITTLLAGFAAASFSGLRPDRKYARSLSASMSDIALKWFLTWIPRSFNFAITVFVSSLSSLAISKTLKRLIQLRSQNSPC
jgi:hypothetical protein